MKQILFSLFIFSLLTACGFHLRGDVTLPQSINPMYISGLSEYKPMYREIRESLKTSGISITTNPTEANSKLEVFEDRLVQNILSVDSRGKVVEYDLIYIFTFSLKDKNNDTLAAKQRMHVQRNFLNPETTVLGKTQEQRVIEESLRKDISNNLLFRIKAALK
jgi:LPS-assembly lipoprotein